MTDPRCRRCRRTESLVMELLRGRERYGLELVDASGGTLKRGSVYVTLARMEEKGFVDSRQEERAAGHQRDAAAPLSRHPVRPESPRRVRDCCARRSPSNRRRRDELRVHGHRVLRALPRPSATFELIVAPALADLQFEEDGGRRSRIADRVAVLRAVAGGVAHDLARDSDSVLQADAAVGLLLHVSGRRSAQASSRPGPSSSSRDGWCSHCRWCR